MNGNKKHLTKIRLCGIIVFKIGDDLVSLLGDMYNLKTEEYIKTRKQTKEVIETLRALRDTNTNPSYRKAMNEAIREIKQIGFARKGKITNCLGKLFEDETTEYRRKLREIETEDSIHTLESISCRHFQGF